MRIVGLPVMVARLIVLPSAIRSHARRTRHIVLRGQPRVWILFSDIWIGDGLQEETWFLEHLDRLGVRLDSYRSTGARAYLYDLSQSGNTPNSTSR